MKTTLYHGTTKALKTLKAGSWLTQISTHALEQAQKRASQGTEAAFVLLVNVDEHDVRKPTDADRNDENRGNNPNDEAWVWISIAELAVVECLKMNEAKQRFCGPKNMLPKV